MDKMNITPILELAVKLIFAAVTIFLIPKIKELLTAKVSEADQKKIIRWTELAVQAAEEAERSGLIDKKAKYQYAKDFLEKRGVTFDADAMQALIDSTVWELFNQFKEDSDSGAESEA
jgi:DNA phosphorothioation-dependent restriction protein DptG|nr:MAG TPA: holin [Caudoviricetes sp.]